MSLAPQLGEARRRKPGIEISSCVGHPGGRGYRDPADRNIWRCIECEEAGRALATMHIDDYPDLTDKAGRRRLSSRLHMRRFHARRQSRAALATGSGRRMAA